MKRHGVESLPKDIAADVIMQAFEEEIELGDINLFKGTGYINLKQLSKRKLHNLRNKANRNALELYYRVSLDKDTPITKQLVIHKWVSYLRIHNEIVKREENKQSKPRS